MRLLFTLLLLSATTSSYSQKFSVEIKGGGSYNTPKLNENALKSAGNVQPLVGARGAVNFEKVRIGLAFETTAEKTSATYQHITEQTKATFFYTNAFLHYKLRLRKSFLYFGPDIGIFSFPKGEHLVQIRHTDNTLFRNVTLNAKTSLVLAGTLGYEQKINETISLQVESGVRFVPIFSQWSGEKIKSRFVYFPATLGLNYTFQKRKQKTEKVDSNLP